MSGKDERGKDIAEEGVSVGDQGRLEGRLGVGVVGEGRYGRFGGRGGSSGFGGHCAD